MRVLVLSPYLPHAKVGHGGGTAVREMVRHLARLHDLSLLVLLRDGERDLVEPTAAELGCRILTIPFQDKNTRGVAGAAMIAQRGIALLRGLLRGLPYYVEKYWSRGLSQKVLEAVASVEPDVIQVEYLQNALLTRDLRRWCDQRRRNGVAAPALFASTHELGSTPRERRLQRGVNLFDGLALRHQAWAWHRLQRQATQWADHTFCVTDEDRSVLERNGGVRCSTMPLGVNTEAVIPAWAPASPPSLLFVGSFEHAPNREAVDFLIDKVWSSVANYRKDMVLEVAGRGSRSYLRRRVAEDPRIRAHGFVDDLDGLYRRCRLFVAPLTVGGGIKIKILEALAHGVPVVTTPIGAEGILTDADDAAWIAPPNDRFAEAVLTALEDEEGAVRKAGNARRLIEEGFSWKAIADRLTRAYGRR